MEVLSLLVGTFALDLGKCQVGPFLPGVTPLLTSYYPGPTVSLLTPLCTFSAFPCLIKSPRSFSSYPKILSWEGIEGGFYILFHVTCCHSVLAGFFLPLAQVVCWLYCPGPGAWAFSLTFLSLKRSTLEEKQFVGFMTVMPNFSSPYIDKFLADCMFLLTWSNPSAGW